MFYLFQEFLAKIDGTGPISAFIAGILYAFAFTSSLATAIFTGFPESSNPYLLALIAGFGSAFYDLAIFSFIRRESHHGFLEKLSVNISRRKFPSWLLTAIGLVVLASPLPDELASGLLSISKLDVKKFIAISFIANFLGISFIMAVS